MIEIATKTVRNTKGDVDLSALVDELNDIFTPLTPEERLRQLYAHFQQDEVLMTSSFGTKSAVLLKLLNEARPNQRIYFIDTSYHFQETLDYKELLTRYLALDVETLHPQKEENQLTRDEMWWQDHPRMCCAINKIAPLEPLKARHKVWISGLMAYQTKFRSHLRVFEKQGDIIKFHPLIDLTEAEFEGYFTDFKLPRHPLQDKGYGSVGCIPCTSRGQGREGRWKGSQRKECGLHPGYFISKMEEQQKNNNPEITGTPGIVKL